jgi:hypothetical protein
MRESETLERGVAAYHDRVARTGFTVEDMEIVLTQVALQAGNVGRAVRILNANGAGSKGRFSVQVVRRWVRESFADRYAAIVEDKMDDIQRLMGERMMFLAEETIDVTHQAVQKTGTALKKGEPTDARDYSTAARNLSQVTANTADKSRLLRDRPTEIVDFELGDAIEELRELVGPKPKAIDGEAEEITDAETS